MKKIKALLEYIKIIVYTPQFFFMVPIIVWVILAWLNTDPASAPEYENSFAI
jgi:hypothetical protein